MYANNIQTFDLILEISLTCLKVVYFTQYAPWVELKQSYCVPLLLCSPLWGVTPTQTGFLFFSVLHCEELLRLKRGSSSSLFSTVRSYSDSNGVPLLLCSPRWGVTPTQTGFLFFSVLHREELLRLKQGSSSSLFSTVRSYSDSNGVPLPLCSPPWGVTPSQTGFLFFSVLHREELLRLKRGSSSSLFSTVSSYSISNGVPLLLCSPPWGVTPTQTGFLFFSVLHREELLRLKRGSSSSLFSTVSSYSISNGVPLLLCSPPWGVTPTQTGFLFFSVLHREELLRLKRGSSSSSVLHREELLRLKQGSSSSLFSTVRSYSDSNGVPLPLCSPPWGVTPTQTGFLFFSVLHCEELLRLKQGSSSSLFSTVRSYPDSNGVPLLLCSPLWGVTPTQTGFLFFSVLHCEELLRLKRGSSSSLFSTVRSYSDSNGVPLLLCSPPWGVTPTQTGFLFLSVLHREELLRLKRGSSSSLFSTVRSYSDSNRVPLLLCSPPWGVTPTQTGFLFFSVLHREELLRLKRGSSSSLFSTVRSYSDSNGVPLLLCSPLWGVTPTQTGFLFFSVLHREELLRLKRGSSSSLFSTVRSYSDSNGVPLLLCSPLWGVTPTQTGFLFFSVLHREELLRLKRGSSSSLLHCEEFHSHQPRAKEQRALGSGLLFFITLRLSNIAQALKVAGGLLKLNKLWQSVSV